MCHCLCGRRGSLRVKRCDAALNMDSFDFLSHRIDQSVAPPSTPTPTYTHICIYVYILYVHTHTRAHTHSDGVHLRAALPHHRDPQRVSGPEKAKQASTRIDTQILHSLPSFQQIQHHHTTTTTPPQHHHLKTPHHTTPSHTATPSPGLWTPSCAACASSCPSPPRHLARAQASSTARSATGSTPAPDTTTPTTRGQRASVCGIE
jgi:hypothetical protein